MVQTTSSPLWALYGLHTRLYEFIIGGAAALFWQRSLDRRTGRQFTIGGLAMIVGAALLSRYMPAAGTDEHGDAAEDSP